MTMTNPKPQRKNNRLLSPTASTMSKLTSIWKLWRGLVKPAARPSCTLWAPPMNFCLKTICLNFNVCAPTQMISKIVRPSGTPMQWRRRKWRRGTPFAVATKRSPYTTYLKSRCWLALRGSRAQFYTDRIKMRMLCCFWRILTRSK